MYCPSTPKMFSTTRKNLIWVCLSLKQQLRAYSIRNKCAFWRFESFTTSFIHIFSCPGISPHFLISICRHSCTDNHPKRYHPSFQLQIIYLSALIQLKEFNSPNQSPFQLKCPSSLRQSILSPSNQSVNRNCHRIASSLLESNEVRGIKQYIIHSFSSGSSSSFTVHTFQFASIQVAL